jgi:Ca2+-binding RTX toxin-like protein
VACFGVLVARDTCREKAGAVVRRAHLIAVVKAFLIGYAFLLVVGCSGTRSEAPQEGQGHTKATYTEQGRTAEATSEEEARCEGTRTFKKPAIGQGVFTTNDIPGCPKGGLLPGTDKPDQLAGEEGADEVRGLGGKDLLTGGHGRDVTDVIYGGPGNDLLIENEARGPGCADNCPGVKPSDLSRRSGPDLSKNVLHGGPGRDILKGAAYDDVLYGGAGDDKELDGLGGEDVLYGGDGDDTLYGTYDGGDQDKLYCGKGKDQYDAGKHDYVSSSCEVKYHP